MYNSCGTCNKHHEFIGISGKVGACCCTEMMHEQHAKSCNHKTKDVKDCEHYDTRRLKIDGCNNEKSTRA